MTRGSNLEALERLSGLEKIRSLADKDCFKGMKMPQTEVLPRNVQLGSGGEIIRMPKLVGRPCFGQIAVFARYGDKLMLPSRGGPPRPSRCRRCQAGDACEKVCLARIKAVPDIQEKWNRFKGKGGQQGLREPKQAPEVQAAFDSLIRALMRHGGFDSVNDLEVIKHYDEDQVRCRAKEAERKRAARRKAILAGYLDDEFEDMLRRHRIYREAQLRAILAEPHFRGVLPSSLNRLPIMSATTTADAWLAREVLRLKKQGINPSSVASEMVRRRPDRYPNHNSLRQRVAQDLARVDLLERLRLPGRSDPVWERFDVVRVLADEEFTPYMISSS